MTTLVIGGSTAGSSILWVDNTNERITLTNRQGGLSFVVNDEANDTSPFVVDEQGKLV